MTKLTETFHVVQTQEGNIYYLVRKDVLSKWGEIFDYIEGVSFYLADEYVYGSWGFGLGSTTRFNNLRDSGLEGLENYSVHTGYTPPTPEFVSAVRAIFDVVLANEDEEETEVPTVKVW
jgi:hypothetical protein